VQTSSYQVIGNQPYVDFANFLRSFIVLFRMSTGEDWYKIMFDCVRSNKNICGQGVPCGNRNF